MIKKILVTTNTRLKEGQLVFTDANGKPFVIESPNEEYVPKSYYIDFDPESPLTGNNDNVTVIIGNKHG